MRNQWSFVMTDIVIHRVRDDTGAFTTMLGASRASIAREARHMLDELPDSLLREFGIVREEIPFLSGVLVADDDAVSPGCMPAAAKRTSGWLAHSFALIALMLAAVSMLVATSRVAFAQDTPIERDRYLVTLGGCNVCHTPGVPGPFGPTEQPSSFVMKIEPPQPATTGGASVR